MSRRIYKVDFSFFEKIDSFDKAQILGFIAADGCIYNGALSINIHKKDLEYLNIIKDRMKYTGIINDNSLSKNKRDSIRLNINSVKIVEDLDKLGIHERKSLTLDFPDSEQVSDKFINSFLLGYFEGDGCITSNKRGSYHVDFCGTYNFCLKLKELIYNKLKINTYLYKADKIYRVVISGNKQVLKFLNWLYENSTFKMTRKYERFLKLKELHQEKYDAGITSLCGENQSRSKLKAFQVLEIRDKQNIGVDRKEIAKQYNVSRHTIDDILSFRRWKNLNINTVKLYQNKI